MLLYTHISMLGHDVPPGHPERPARLSAVLAALEGMPLDRREAPFVSRAALARVHDESHIEAMEEAFALTEDRTFVALDADTNVCAGSREACERAAGAVVAAVDAVLDGDDEMAFCAVRPPGHHAEPGMAMGFCIFNNVAIGALHALDARGLSKVAVIDFDVHHGNGTQTIAERDARILFASTHQSPCYPGTGLESERGVDGNVVNAPLPPDSDGARWRASMKYEVLPAIDNFAPELILVSAGFDAHRADPLAQLNLTEDDFAWAGRELRLLALRHCKGRIVSTLEGGYDLAALAGSAKAYLEALRS